MKSILFTGWNHGLEKVELTKLIRAEAHLPLSVAKDVVDQILDGRQPEVNVGDDTAESFLERAKSLGADAVLLGD